jgi:hypothetical protein
MPAVGDQAGVQLLGQAGMVAVRVADLRSPARVGLGKDGRTALVAAGAGPIRTGETGAASSSTATGTANAKPKPASASPPPGHA